MDGSVGEECVAASIRIPDLDPQIRTSTFTFLLDVDRPPAVLADRVSDAANRREPHERRASERDCPVRRGTPRPPRAE
jgi:hypothetical protein